MAKTRLRLNRERLAELSNHELASVAAGYETPKVILTGMETYTCPTFPLKGCAELTYRCFTGNPSLAC